MSKIGYDKFFNFDDSTPLDKAAQDIEKFQGVLQKMVSSVENSSARLNDAWGVLAANAQQVMKEVKELNISVEKNQKVLMDDAKVSQELVSATMALKVSEEQNARALKQLAMAQEEVNKAKAKTSGTIKNETGSLDDLRKRLSEAEKAYRGLGESVDGSVKQSHLQNVRGLAFEYTNADKALKEAKKGAVLAAGSYNELNNQVTEAKKRLKEMGSNVPTKEFKNLEKFVKDGSKQLKDFDAAIGDNQRNVGNYKDALTALPGPLQGVVSGIQGATKAGLAFIATPIGLVIGAIAIAVGTLAAYFQSSVEGQDDLNKVMAMGSAIFEVFLDVVELIGKALWTAITEPQKAFEGFMELIKPFEQAMTDAWTNPQQALKDFGQLILDNIINRFKAVGVAFQGIQQLLDGDLAGGLKTLTNAWIQGFTGVTDVVDKIGEALGPIADEIEKRMAMANMLSDLENKIRKEKIKDVVDDAITEMQFNEKLLASKDKIRLSDQQRFVALKEARKLIEDQTKGDIDLIQMEIDAQRMRIKIAGGVLAENKKISDLTTEELSKIRVKYELIEQLASLEAGQTKLQADLLQKRKNLQKQEIQFIQEEAKEQEAAAKRRIEADRAARNIELNEAIKINDDIASDTKSTYEEIVNALVVSGEAKEALLRSEEQKAIEVAKEGAMGRAELSAEEADRIFNDRSLTLEQIIQLEREAKEQIVNQDTEFIAERDRIQKEYASKIKDVDRKLQQDLETNVFKKLQSDFENLNDTVSTGVNNELAALNEAFAAGEISSAEDFERQKIAIQEKAQRDSLDSQLQYLQDRATQLKEYGYDTTQIEREISNVKLAISEQDAQKRLEIEREIQGALKNLQQTTVDAAMSIVASSTEREQQRLDERLEAITAQSEYELEVLELQQAQELAQEGLTEEQRFQIQAQYAEQRAFIQNEQAEKEAQIKAQQATAARKQAMFEKAVAITTIGVNTAVAISKALASAPPPANFILAALVGAAGAIQLAAAIAKPIPAFAEGTEYAPGGFALVNEEGIELIKEPGRPYKMVGSDGPTIVDIAKGSKVFNAEKTAEMLGYNDFVGQVSNGFKRDAEEITFVSEGQNNRELISALRQEFAGLEHTIRTKKELHIDMGGIEAKVKRGFQWSKFIEDYYG